MKSRKSKASTPTFQSAKFWSDFGRNFWEKKPGRFDATSPLSAVDVFELLVSYCDLCRERDELVGLKFYVDGVCLEPFETFEHLPIRRDQSLEGYHQRMRKQFRDYGLVCDELMWVNKKHWQSLGRLVTGLYDAVGRPNRFSEMGLYLGNYRKTPFGVHVDKCGVLSFPVVGSKSFRIWDPDFVEANPELKEAFSYEEFKSNSKVLTVRPGEMSYWPSQSWHIAEGDGKFSCTWSIGVWVDRTLTDVASDSLSKFLAKKLGAVGRKTVLRLPKPASKGAKFPSELKLIAKKIAGLSEREIKLELERWWTSQSKLNGFKNRPL